MVASVLLSQSTLLSDLVPVRGWRNRLGIAIHDPRVLQNLGRDLLAGPDGRVFFAHVLLPHHPFVYQPDCSIDYDSQLWERWASHLAAPEEAAQFNQVRYARFMDQADCAFASLAVIFESMKQAGIFDRSTIVLHGDHGARIAANTLSIEQLENLTPADYRAHFSILFAVKLPGGSYSEDQRVLPLTYLLEEVSGTVLEHAAGADPAPVLIDELSDDPERTQPYVYLEGSYPLHRVDINIFE